MTWDDVVTFMNERCADCGCFLNNSPDCEDRCIHQGIYNHDDPHP